MTSLRVLLTVCWCVLMQSDPGHEVSVRAVAVPGGVWNFGGADPGSAPSAGVRGLQPPLH